MPAKVTVGKIHFGRSKFDTLYKGKKSWKMVLLENKKNPVHTTNEKQLNILYNLYVQYYYFSILRHKTKTGILFSEGPSGRFSDFVN